MSNASTRTEQDRLFPGQTLPEICMNLKMWCDGSFDCMSYNERKDEHIKMLNETLKNWDFENLTLFDSIVYQMVECTRNMLEGK